MSTPDIDAVREYILRLHESICNELELIDGEAQFEIDDWKHETGGGCLV